jgi:hypothetical protein
MPRIQSSPVMEAAAVTTYIPPAPVTWPLESMATGSSGTESSTILGPLLDAIGCTDLACSSTKRGAICVTYSIFDDLDATTFTPFLGCGDRGATKLELARTWTGSGVTQATKSLGSSSDLSRTTDSGESQSSGTADAQPTETNLSCKQGPTAYLKIWIGLLLVGALFG